MRNGVTKSILLLGGPASGKSCYTGQLVLRLNAGKSRLKIHGTADNIEPLEGILVSLEEGRAPEHTATSVNTKIELPVTADNGNTADLVWPEYGGEQISEMMKERRINREWYDRLSRATGWLIFIR